LSFEEWMDKNFPSLVAGDFEYNSRYEVWNAALENQKLEKVVDEQKDEKAFINIYAGKSELVYQTSDRLIWIAALKYARGVS